MPIPTIRQLNGFVLIVNTVLPFLLVVAVYVMWSLSIQTFRVEACSSLSHNAKVLASINNANSSSVLLKSYQLENAKAIVTTGGECAIEQGFNDLLVVDAYQTMKNNVNAQVTAVGAKVDGVKNKVAKAVPKFPDIYIRQIPNLKLGKINLSSPINSVIRFINKIDNNVNTVLTKLSSVVTNAFTNVVDPERKRIYLEFEKTSYRQAVILDTFKAMLTATVEAFEKFYWLLIVLIIWLPISYVFWAYQRLTRGWQMIRGQ